MGSLLADWLLVKLGTHVFPSTRGFVHFQFGDYAKLTIIGVVIACAGWPLVTTLTSQPRRLFFQAAIVITIVLFAPDAYIWHNGASVAKRSSSSFGCTSRSPSSPTTRWSVWPRSVAPSALDTPATLATQDRHNSRDCASRLHLLISSTSIGKKVIPAAGASSRIPSSFETRDEREHVHGPSNPTVDVGPCRLRIAETVECESRW